VRRKQILGNQYSPNLNCFKLLEIEGLSDHLREPAETEQEARVEKSLKKIRAQVEEGAKSDAASAALVPARLEGPAKPLSGLAPYDHGDLARTMTSASLLNEVRTKYSYQIRRAAAERDAAAFWAGSDAAFTALENAMERDGLAEIRRHAVGPRAQAKLASYENQAVALWRAVSRLKEKNGIGPRQARTTAYAKDMPPVQTVDADSAAYDRLHEKIAKIGRKDIEAQQSRQMRTAGAVFLFDELQARRQGVDPSALVRLVNFYSWHARRAEKNPDRLHILSVRQQLREPTWKNVPGLDAIYAVWRESMKDGRHVRLLEKVVNIWSVSLLLTAMGFFAELYHPGVASVIGGLKFPWR
jgi:hypothetical protein